MFLRKSVIIESLQLRLIFPSRSLYEQKALLNKKTSMTILQRMKDDASSLVCIRDSTSFATSRASWISCITEASSQISREFEFDRDIQSSRVYQSHFKSLIRRTLCKFKSHGRQRHLIPDGSGGSKGSESDVTYLNTINPHESSHPLPPMIPISPSPSSHRLSSSSSTATIPIRSRSLKLDPEPEEMRSIVQLLPQGNNEDNTLEVQSITFEPSDTRALEREPPPLFIASGTLAANGEGSPSATPVPMQVTPDLLSAVPGNIECGLLQYLPSEVATSDAEHLEDRIILHDYEMSDTVPVISPIMPQPLEAKSDSEMSAFDFQIGCASEICSSSQQPGLADTRSLSSYTTDQPSKESPYEAITAVSPQIPEAERPLAPTAAEAQVSRITPPASEGDNLTSARGIIPTEYSSQNTESPIPNHWNIRNKIDITINMLAAGNCHVCGRISCRIHHLKYMQVESLTCTFCHKNFVSLEILRLHLLNLLSFDLDNVHTITEILRCQFCHRSYTRIDHLRQHVRYCDIDLDHVHGFDFQFDFGSKIESTSASESTL